MSREAKAKKWTPRHSARSRVIRFVAVLSTLRSWYQPGAKAPAPRHVARIGRNDPYPGDGARKYQDCHEKDGSASSNSSPESATSGASRVREHLEQRGVCRTGC